LPVAYIPALVFHQVERLDVVKMSYLMTSPDVSTDALTPRAQAMADAVLRQFTSREVEPRIARVLRELPLFGGLSEEQFHRLAGVCRLTSFQPGEVVFRRGEAGQELHVVLEGEVAIAPADSEPVVGVVRAGECLGEMSLLTADAHSATATALNPHRDGRVGAPGSGRIDPAAAGYRPPPLQESRGGDGGEAEAAGRITGPRVATGPSAEEYGSGAPPGARGPLDAARPRPSGGPGPRPAPPPLAGASLPPSAGPPRPAGAGPDIGGGFPRHPAHTYQLSGEGLRFDAGQVVDPVDTDGLPP
jgi:Cyclic nucleotide-binding domain